ncbi:MAG: hypothetical protein ACRC8B_16395 [Aeromonas sobria]|uniref:hypothetical protein n=1 Tax=Aeromonas sobria TaxID=646 RepID=UPI003F2F5E7F
MPKRFHSHKKKPFPPHISAITTGDDASRAVPVPDLVVWCTVGKQVQRQSGLATVVPSHQVMVIENKLPSLRFQTHIDHQKIPPTAQNNRADNAALIDGPMALSLF